MTEYLTYSLLNNYSNDTQIEGFLDNYDFYVLPVVNPDGKESCLASRILELDLTCLQDSYTLRLLTVYGARTVKRKLEPDVLV